MDTWKAGKDVKKLMSQLIAKHHPDLALIEHEIEIIFREKATEKAGKVILGSTKKAPPSLPVLTDKNYTYKFIIELGADAWSSLSDRQRQALLDHHLCSMLVQEDAEKGTISCSIRPPDFSGYKGEVERWGMWWPMDDETLSVIEEMFGKKAEERSKTSTAASSSDIDDVLDALSKN